MLITLDSGKIVKVESFEYSYTYGGVLCGLPNEKMNRSVFEDIKYPSNWGSRKTLKIKPSTYILESLYFIISLTISLFIPLKVQRYKDRGLFIKKLEIIAFNQLTPFFHVGCFLFKYFA